MINKKKNLSLHNNYLCTNKSAHTYTLLLQDVDTKQKRFICQKIVLNY